ncbi:hypothetical protein [Bradyrhizobium sp. 76]|uniref:hypothetical protein n=1 Tax=Bradyrhizobium sp. 76 TaxID=2782680 RepID=UPI001FF85781|nr:hypothetical protein [Bradyrhizobium sp. 76]MCK1404955.1 hypothetical protein [Bradyrhizobium sp. 76]
MEPLFAVRFNLTAMKTDVAVQLLHGVNHDRVVMKEIVDQVLKDYNRIYPLDRARIAQAREKVSKYVVTIASAGQKDPRRLVVFARAYLKELHEGPDSRFTGC